MKKALFALLAGFVWIAGLTGCATNLTHPAQAPQPAKVKLGTFSQVEVTPVVLAPAYASSSANQKAKRKIEEILMQRHPMVLPNIKQADAGAPATGRPGTLRIEPMIKEIKFIGGMARFWVGAMAGSSAVLMQVNYIDCGNNTVIASPEFYAEANSMGGAWTMGATDNMMLDRIANDIVNYTQLNR